MSKFVREFRLIPVALFATICLFTLKVMGILLDGGYTLGVSSPVKTEGARTSTAPAVTSSAASNTATTLAANAPRNPPLPPGAKQSWAQEMFNYPDVTGSVGETKPAEKPAVEAKAGGPAGKVVDPPRDSGGTPVTMDNSRPTSAAERAILERLQERRQEIEARGREIEIRDSLVKAAEKRLEARAAELKDLEARVNAAMLKKEDADAGRFKGLVAMYENMKARDAAKIFDRLELPVLVQVTSQINPRKMSDILGQMSPEAAERLTVELANRASATEKIPTAAELPKIQGRPSGT
jgi:flagellar motility protein MotE (MotC chaperone)